MRAPAEIETLLNRHQLAGRTPSLEGMRQALERIGSFAQGVESRKILLVAGTNGKGSTIASLEHLLRATGETVGLFTSPHLMSLTERFRIGGREISVPQLSDAFEFVYPFVSDLNLTRFEILTLMAVDLFASGRVEPAVDRMLMEVGLGGRFDATNALPHDFALITRLGLDHQKILGHTLSEIAKNKFGVVTPNATVVHAPLPAEVIALAHQIARETNSGWIESPQAPLEIKPGRSPEFWLDSPWGKVKLQLPGKRGAENTMLALTAFAELGFDPREWISSLSSLQWPGRMERVAVDPCPIYLSGDHNEQGVQSLCEMLAAYEYRTLHVLVGLGVEKNADTLLGLLSQIPRVSLYLTETPFKGLALHGYGKWLKIAQGSHADPMQALQLMRERAHSDDLILVTGSLYLVGELRKHLVGTPSF